MSGFDVLVVGVIITGTVVTGSLFYIQSIEQPISEEMPAARVLKVLEKPAFPRELVISEDIPASRQLGPMQKPVLPEVGDERHTVRDGKNIVYKVVRVEGDKVSWRSNSSCEFTEIHMAFAPVLQWSGCLPWEDGTPRIHDGKQVIDKLKGDIWPLGKKGKIDYSVSGGNINGESWKEKRKCHLRKSVRIKVPAGEFDTYKVRCNQSGGSLIWWISPKLEKIIAFRDKYGLTQLTKP